MCLTLTTDKQYPQSVETVIVQLEVLFALGPTMDIVHWTTQVKDTQFMQLNTACTNHNNIFFAVLVPTSFALTEGKVHVLLGQMERCTAWKGACAAWTLGVLDFYSCLSGQESEFSKKINFALYLSVISNLGHFFKHVVFFW